MDQLYIILEYYVYCTIFLDSVHNADVLSYIYFIIHLLLHFENCASLHKLLQVLLADLEIVRELDSYGLFVNDGCLIWFFGVGLNNLSLFLLFFLYFTLLFIFLVPRLQKLYKLFISS
jgi:hypothetical protein